MSMRSRTTGGTNPSRQRAVVRPVYEDFKPMSEWIRDREESDILLIYLPGFMKENLKVSTEDKNIIRVRGERSIADNKWHQVLQDYQAPDYCNVQSTRARFEGGILTITVPKKTTVPIGPKKEAKPPQEQASMAPQKPKDDLPKKAQTKPMSQKKGKDEKPPTTSGEKQKDKESSEALASENTRLMESEHVKQDGGTRESSEAKGKPEKPEIPEMNAEKSRGSCLLDRVENVTEKIDEESKYKQPLKGLTELDDEKHMPVNVGVGVAVLVIVALGTYAVYRCRK